MKRTSAAVLALLFSSCNAIKLNKDEESEPVPSPQAEKVHVLDLGMHTMSNSPKDFPEQAFPNIRTAFYAQTGSELTYDHQNGLWLTQKGGEYDTTAVKGPPEGQIGDVVYEHGMNATDGIPGDRSKSLGPSFAQREHKVDPISPENYDPWVYQTSKENMGNFPQWHWEGKGGKDNLAQKKHHHHHQNEQIVGKEEMDEEVHDFVDKHVTGLSEQHHHKHHKHHKKPDIAERGMDEEVHGFATEILPPLNTRQRSDMPFIPNGSDPSAFKGAASLAHKKPDIAERGMDEEVHGFATEILPPLNTRVRSDMPFIPNGSDPSAFQGAAFSENNHHHKHHKKDVAERGMDEEVHGFVWEALPPLNTRVRSTEAFIPNGSDPKAFDPSFAEKKHHKKDIAERGMDEEVHGFVWEALPPLNTRVRSTDPFIPNGSDPKAHDPSFAEKKHHKKDIAERGMDEEVHGFVWEALPPLNTRVRSTDAFIPNGSDPKAFDPSFAEESHHHHHKHHHKNNKRDVAERGMDEEVHGFVHEAIPPLNVRKRSDDAFIPNGSAIGDWNENAFAEQHHHKKPDIAERGMDEDVWGFTSEAMPPLNTRIRSDLPFIPNGSKNQWGSLSQHNDIAERGMENHWVHPFSAEQDVVLPTPNPWTRPYLPFESNGASNVYAQTDAAPRKDIANKEVRPDVWVTVHEMINPVALGRFREPRPAKPEEVRTWDDGPKPKEAPTPEFKFKKADEPDEEEHKKKLAAAAEEGKEKAKKAKAEQAEEDAKPDEEAAGATPTKKEAEPEKAEDKKKREADEAADKKASEEADKEDKAQEANKKKKDAEKEGKKEEKKAALVQTASKDEKKGDDAPAAPSAPEKVHVLEPTEYKEKADTNTPNIRTTFYDKKTKKAQI